MKKNLEKYLMKSLKVFGKISVEFEKPSKIFLTNSTIFEGNQFENYSENSFGKFFGNSLSNLFVWIFSALFVGNVFGNSFGNFLSYWVEYWVFFWANRSANPLVINFVNCFKIFLETFFLRIPTRIFSENPFEVILRTSIAFDLKNPRRLFFEVFLSNLFENFFFRKFFWKFLGKNVGNKFLKILVIILENTYDISMPFVTVRLVATGA